MELFRSHILKIQPVPFARTVTDAAILLGSLTGVDEKDVATHKSEGMAYQDYTPYLDAKWFKGSEDWCI